MSAVPAVIDVLVSVHRRDDEPVLATMPLKPDSDPAALSRFADDRWNLTPAIFRGNVPPGHRSLNFGAIADPLQKLTAKEFLWARLNTYGARIRCDRLVPSEAYGVLGDIKHFMAFVAARHGMFSMCAVDQTLLDSYLSELRAGPRKAERVARRIHGIVHLHRHGSLLTSGGFDFEPWRGRSAVKIAGARPGENRTFRIPEPVIASLLHWALKYVDLFSSDISAARDEHDRLMASSHLLDVYAAGGRGKTISVDNLVATRLRDFLDERRNGGRGVAIWQHPKQKELDPNIGVPLNYALLNLRIGCQTRSLKRQAIQQILREAIREFGLEIGGMDTPVAVDPDTGQPWRARFDSMSLMHEEKMLQAACYIICAYLTGMRDCEVQAMRAGCHEIKRSADGLVDQHIVHSTAYKMRGDGGRGTPAQWITIAPVARAVAVLERLSRAARARHGSDGLWPVLKDKARTSAHLNAQACLSIQRFQGHLNSAFGTPDSPVVPPGPDGCPWRLNTRQFRRTVAWYIANRPFGTIAGKIQYKHASIAMFEGYSGSSASGFRREIEQERALGRLDDIVEHYEEFRRGLKPTGVASARLLAEFSRIQHELGDLAGRVVDHTRLRAMLGHLGRTLHVGFLNDCFFEPATALCLNRATEAAQQPVLSHCSPDRCPNACITRRHLTAWQESIAGAERLLASPGLPPLQRTALEQDNARKRRLIAPLTKDLP
jgi:hypothetical protein